MKPMFQLFFSLLLSGFLLSCALLSAGPLEEAIAARVAQGPGKVWLAAKNLKTGKSFDLRGAEKVRTASTIKLPILVEVFAQAAEGKLKLDERLTLREADMVSGSGVLREFSPGIPLPLRDVARMMIVVSDNTATNMIIQRVTADAVNARMDRLGLPGTRSMRKVRGDGTQLKAAEGWSKAGLLPENQRFGLGSSTSLEMIRLLEMLEKGELAGSKEMLEILKRQQYTDGIARKLGDVKTASKSGSLDHLRSDVAIVYTKNGPIAIAITVDDIPAIDYSVDNPGLLLIADLAKLLVAAL
jgi:beta-lactamase class A